MKKLIYIGFFTLFVACLGCQTNQETKETNNNTTEENKEKSVSSASTTEDSTTQKTKETAKAKAGEEPVIEFVSKEHDFGEVKEGEVVKHAFKFKNTGKTPLVISEAKPGCGCTVPKWPKEPIAPGAESEIVAEFNTQGQGGGIKEKQITIKANTTPAETILKFKANVNSISNVKGPIKQ
jgi:hypothetical protein